MLKADLFKNNEENWFIFISNYLKNNQNFSPNVKYLRNTNSYDRRNFLLHNKHWCKNQFENMHAKKEHGKSIFVQKLVYFYTEILQKQPGYLVKCSLQINQYHICIQKITT